MDRLLQIHEILHERIPVSAQQWRGWVREGKAPLPEKRGNMAVWPDSKITRLIIDLGGKGKGFYRAEKVMEILGLNTRSALYARISRGQVPKGIKLFGQDKIVAYVIEDIDPLGFDVEAEEEKKEAAA